MLKTRNARFTAAQQLVTHERFSIITLAMLSIFLIGVAVALLAVPDVLDSEATKFFGALSIVASVWILAITLYDYALGRGLLAYRLHRNALKITKIMRSLERELACEHPNKEALRRIAEEYESEIFEAEVNHSPGDYQFSRYQSQKAEHWFQAIWFFVRNFMMRITRFISSVPSNLMVIMVIFGSIFWYFFIR